MRSAAWSLALGVLVLLCSLPASCTPTRRVKKPSRRLPKFHRELKETYIRSLMPTGSPATTGVHPLPGYCGEPVQASSYKHKEGFLGIETVGGPEALGKSRPNEWSGLQTTIPSAVPGRVQGFTIKKF